MGNKKVRSSEKERIIGSLAEREKELNCLYAVEDILFNTDESTDTIFKSIVSVIPAGWQFPDICHAVIEMNGHTYGSSTEFASVSTCESPIVVDKKTIGKIQVVYDRDVPKQDDGNFLNEERRLLKTISTRIAQFVHQKEIEQSLEQRNSVPPHLPRGEWQLLVNLLCQSDVSQLGRISRKMINHLLMKGVDDAKRVLESGGRRLNGSAVSSESNEPRTKSTKESMASFSDETFELASKHLSDEEILALVKRWIHEDKILLLIKPLVNVHASLTDICDAMQRFQNLKPDGIEISESTLNSMRVALIRRFLTEQLDFISIAKNYVEPEAFFGLVERLIFPTGSHGKLGGKSAGIFLSDRILEKKRSTNSDIGTVKVPKTWRITSEGLHEFVFYNNLEEFYEQKYKTLDEVRQDYPHIIQVFKSSHFPKEIVKGLSMALDDLGEVPIIVRSSSLLEDRLGAAFSGKYRSLFLPNLGDKQERLEVLLDAISEVYASTFGPDPIQYRTERGLIDFNEQMAILIQEVVGTKVGPYFFPAYSGVAFSNNEFRWSPRIKRDDGLLRMVPGLGTRAVDRLTEDYPVLAAINQPGLRLHVTTEEVMRYAPKQMDVINLETKRFETVEVADVMKEWGDDYPAFSQIFSICKESRVQQPIGFTTDFKSDPLYVTFNGLFSNTPFLKQVRAIIDSLSEVLETPVDIEFASDGKDFYLLQCRPQSAFQSTDDEETPSNIPKEQIVFTANRFVSSGSIDNIRHIVYVDPVAYSNISSLSTLRQVGEAVGKLNALLPRKRFILLGPGRWGSRGDIKLGVRVNYSDINNTAALLEVAKQDGNYLPDLSFGTHFFQDLVEAGIHYLPLYPDDSDVSFNELFFYENPNHLPTLAPEYATLSCVLKVIAVEDVHKDASFRIVMNAEADHAVGFWVQPG